MQKKWHDCVLRTFIGNKGKHLSNSGKGMKGGSNDFIAIFAVQYTDRTKMKRRRIMAAIYIVLGIVLFAIVAILLFLNQPSFGHLPQGERLERISRSPNFRDGQFHNLESTATMTSKYSRWEAMWRFLVDKPEGIVPELPMDAVKAGLKELPAGSDLIVWFGHSSYLLQLSGRRFLVDPVFYKASPVSFVNRPFPGTDIYRPEDLPMRIDYLVITHDHWDHLDYETVIALRRCVGKVICPLGVGEHFEYWGYDKSQLVELDWNESSQLIDGFAVHCLPARHFSGRGLQSNKTLWASFLLATPSLTVFVGGDGGYGRHFRDIGTRFPGIDVAILENGQYNEDWRYIHTMPQELGLAARDIGAKRVITMHHSKYALARHRWDEPLDNEKEAARQYDLNLVVLRMGVPCGL